MLDALHVAWLWLHGFRHFTVYLTLAWIGYVLWLGGWIVLQKRAPAATLSWLLGLAALPPSSRRLSSRRLSSSVLSSSVPSSRVSS